jgi:Trk-type K+ transport system membrane component
MEIAEQSRFETTRREVRSYDATITFAYVLLTIVLLIAIYLDSMSSGTAAGDFASMVVFP